MFKTRLLSGIVLIAILLTFIITGGDALVLFLLFVSTCGLVELYRVFDINIAPLGMLGYMATLLYYINFMRDFIKEPLIIFMGLLLLLLVCFVVKYPKYKVEQIMAAFFGVFYVAIMISYVYKVRALDNGALYVWLVFLSSWGCDTLAYCVGMTCSKLLKLNTHKMTPVLSPNKTVEGAIGGLVGAGLLTLIYTTVMKNYYPISNGTVVLLIIVTMVAALFSMVGDLAASGIKRAYDIKDY